MDNINFEVETIGASTDYIYKLPGGRNELNVFTHKMLINNNIREFIPYILETRGGEYFLRYSPGNHVTLAMYEKNRFSSNADFAKVIVSILKTVKNTEDYLINRRFILFDPDHMFINTADLSISMICVPVKNAQDVRLKAFMADVAGRANFGNSMSPWITSETYKYDFDKRTLDEAIEYFENFVKGKVPAWVIYEPVNHDSRPEPENKPLPGAEHTPQYAQNHSKKPVRDFVNNLVGNTGGSFDGNTPPNIKSAPGGIEDHSGENTVPLGQWDYDDDEGNTVLGEDSDKTEMVSQRAFLKDLSGNIYPINSDAFTIGRDKKGRSTVDLALNGNAYISHNHATIYNNGGKYILTDNNSGNGTTVDGQRLLKGGSASLESGMHIKIYNVEFTFFIE